MLRELVDQRGETQLLLQQRGDVIKNKIPASKIGISRIMAFNWSEVIANHRLHFLASPLLRLTKFPQYETLYTRQSARFALVHIVDARRSWPLPKLACNALNCASCRWQQLHSSIEYSAPTRRLQLVALPPPQTSGKPTPCTPTAQV